MDDKICVDLFTDRIHSWMRDYDIRESLSVKGSYYTVTVDPSEKKQLLRIAHRHRIKYRWYEKRWARSSNYRDAFFRNYDPPYRCRYCNKKLTKKKMVIDHIVPIAAVKKSASARRLLTLHGIQNVNDPKNLAPSCVPCNSRKRDHLGLWYIRGVLGKYKIFWAAYYASFVILILVALYSLYATNAVEYLQAIFF